MSRVVIPRIQRDDPIGQLRLDHTGLTRRIRCALIPGHFRPAPSGTQLPHLDLLGCRRDRSN
jgi:hypothetical protein